jgi:hypothetical protein
MDKEEIRLVLQTALETVFPELPVIFRPSGNYKLTYPCVTYEPKTEEVSYANNVPYTIGTQFQVMFIAPLPGYSDTRLIYSLIPQGVVVVRNNSYTTNDLAHDVFIVSVHTT